MRRAIIPLFIPHDGCPYRCTFCNQWRITGRDESVTAATVASTIEAYLASTNKDYHWEAAFYGGTFTALPRERQAALLAPATAALRAGKLEAIRLSTRPDCIDAGSVAFLRAAGVTTVELGVQSLDDTVLALAKRGHRAAAVKPAVELLRAGGLQVGIQLMPGLRGESFLTLRRTIRAVRALQPDLVRIYPVLVMADTELAAEYEAGKYTPLSLAAAVMVTAWWRMYLARAGIPVIRMGLQATAELDSGTGLLAGPYEPAFGEHVIETIYGRRLRRALRRYRGALTLYFAPRDTSKLWGPRHRQKQRLERDYQGVLSWQAAKVPVGIVIAEQAGKRERIYLEDELYREPTESQGNML